VLAATLSDVIPMAMLVSPASEGMMRSKQLDASKLSCIREVRVVCDICLWKISIKTGSCAFLFGLEPNWPEFINDNISARCNTILVFY